jgi:5-methylcytosine-specific restriction endonuclease McrA
VTSDPRRQPRIRDPDLLRLLHAAPWKECCLCGTPERLELHHVYPRGQGGDDKRGNLVWLCKPEHQRVTVNDTAVIRLLGEHIVAERPDIIEYLRWKLGDGAGEWMRRRLLAAVFE